MADDIANPASVVESKIESLVICTRKKKAPTAITLW